jgi:hypothetical protein
MRSFECRKPGQVDTSLKEGAQAFMMSVLELNGREKQLEGLIEKKL